MLGLAQFVDGDLANPNVSLLQQLSAQDSDRALATKDDAKVHMFTRKTTIRIPQKFASKFILMGAFKLRENPVFMVSR